jgi:rare lipoprotein A (peptidoglycan hydrolase)
MRLILPAVAVATVLSVAAAMPATAKQAPRDQRPQRVAGHVSLHVSRHAVISGEQLVIRGRVRPEGRHRVKVVFRGHGGGLVTATTEASGAFTAHWEAGTPGNYRVRAYGVHDRHLSGSTSPTRKLTAFRYAGASYYGPGLYGNGVACGGTLLPDTLGVAHKTLPCGTKVKLRYHGRSITVPVIDRGPYVAGRDYDLTEATKEKLGFPGVDTVLANR